MKKVFTMFITAVLWCTCSSCASNNTSSNESKPQDQIAFQTVCEFLGKDVQRASDKKQTVNATILTTDEKEKSDNYCLWEYELANEDNSEVLFLFNQDENIILATEQTETLFNEEGLVLSTFMENKNEENYANGGFAWKFEGIAYAFLNSTAGYNCTSIWLYNEADNNATLIWWDENNTAWESY